MTVRKTKQYLNCLWCDTPLEGRSNKKFCCHECGVSWRTKNIYRYKYSYAHRNKDPRNFLKTLLSKRGLRYDRSNINVDDLITLCEKQEWLCAISKEPLTFIAGKGKVNTNASLDQICPGKGYSLDNVQIVCRVVNIMKYDMSEEELKMWCKKILDQPKRDGRH